MAGLGTARPTVTVASVSDEDKSGRSTARLRYSWKLSGVTKRWAYTTTASMRHGDTGKNDGWTVALAPTLAHPDLRRRRPARAHQHLRATAPTSSAPTARRW